MNNTDELTKYTDAELQSELEYREEQRRLDTKVAFLIRDIKQKLFVVDTARATKIKAKLNAAIDTVTCNE